MKLLLSLLLFALSVPAQAALIAELSDHTVSIKTDFRGENILLFGTTGQPLQPGDNIVVTIKGPQQAVLLRHKAKTGPVWHNSGAVRFDNAWSFYQFYSARPLAGSVPPDLRMRQEIGTMTLPLPITMADIGHHESLATYQEMLRQKKREAGLYVDNPNSLTVLDSLFWVNLSIPVNVPVGRYIVDVFLARNGEIDSALRLPLDVFKDGAGAEMALFAGRHPLVYGVAGVILAVAAGWGASLLFRKR